MKGRFPIPDLQSMAVCQAIRMRRIELGMNYEDLADKIGVHRTFVSFIERESSNFSMQVFFRLAAELELSPVELLELSQKVMSSKKGSKTAARP